MSSSGPNNFGDTLFLLGEYPSRLAGATTPAVPAFTGLTTPRTETSRQRTARTGTVGRTRTGNIRADDAFLVALIENVSKEVGFCVYNLHGFDVELRQFSDSNSFSTTIATLCIFNPVEILLSLSSANGPLEGALQAHEFTRRIKISYIARPHFNETQGALVIERLSTERCSHLANLGSSPYYLALASCGALLRYVEHAKNTLFTPGTLRIVFEPNEGTLFLDIATMEGLELVKNGRSQVGTMVGKSQLEVMKKTKTRAGSRLLRRSLLEPPADLNQITLRQDVVEEFSRNEDLYFNTVAVLSKFPDLERALAGLLARENARVKKQNWSRENEKNRSRPGTQILTSSFRSSRSTATSGYLSSRPVGYMAIDDIRAPNISTIRNVIFIKAALDTLNEVLHVLEGVQSSLLRAISRSMRIGELKSLREAIHEAIVPEAVPSKDVEHMRLQGAFALRAGTNEKLDIARKTLSENIEEMHTLTESLKAKYDLRKLTLAMTAKRGYHITLPAKVMRLEDLPQEFIQVQKGGRLHRFSTVALNSLNNRYIGSLEEIWTHTDFELQSLLQTVFDKQNIIALYRLCDGVALLDLLSSFVTYSSLSPVPHIRPRLTATGPIALKQVHHPLLLSFNSTASVPNDIFMDETCALHILTGQNQSGKSTLLKCLGLVAVISQTGASIPADFASFRILHRILSRFNTSDDISHRQSHFSREMHDVAGILDSIRGNSISGRHSLASQSLASSGASRPRLVFDKRYKHVLVLMDELGRSTSTLDGISIAFSVLERLIATPGVFVFFTTHFLGLAALTKVHPVVKVFHLGTTAPLQPSVMISQPGSTIIHGDSAVTQPRDRVEPADQITSRTQFTYRLAEGVLQQSRYGIDTARAAGFPKDVIDNAIEIRQKLPVRRVANPNEFAALHFAPQAMARAKKASGTLAVAARVSMLKSTISDPERLRLQLEKFQGMVRKTQNAHFRETQASQGPASTAS